MGRHSGSGIFVTGYGVPKKSSWRLFINQFATDVVATGQPLLRFQSATAEKPAL